MASIGRKTRALGATACVLFVLTACGGNGDDNEESRNGLVDISATAQDAFDPDSVTVNRGDTITWTNRDLDEHTVTLDDASISTGPVSDVQFPDGIPPGGSYSFVVPGNAASGTRWLYHCRFHGAPGDGQNRGAGMSGEITVR